MKALLSYFLGPGGPYSRRISLRHRFVYQIIDEPLEEDGKSYEGVVKIISM